MFGATTRRLPSLMTTMTTIDDDEMLSDLNSEDRFGAPAYKLQNKLSAGILKVSSTCDLWPILDATGASDKKVCNHANRRTKKISGISISGAAAGERCTTQPGHVRSRNYDVILKVMFMTSPLHWFFVDFSEGFILKSTALADVSCFRPYFGRRHIKSSQTINFHKLCWTR